MATKQEHYEKLAKSLIKKFDNRGIEAFYVVNKEEGLNKALSFINAKSTVAWGGSETLKDIGFVDAIKNSGCITLDRLAAKTEEEKDEVYSKTAICDYYFMSTSAFTLDGQLVNMDAYGNRLASLLHGPKNVIIVTGLNKLCTDVDSAIKRVRNLAAPLNANRLDKNTPCVATGTCANCMKEDCICAQMLITRRSDKPGRIKVILVGEELGF